MEIKEFLDIVYDKRILKILEKYFDKKPFITKIDAFHSENNGTKKMKWKNKNAYWWLKFTNNSK